MKQRKFPSPTALALAAALLPFAAAAQSTYEPPVDPVTPVDTEPPEFQDPLDPADPNAPIDPRDVQDPIDPAHQWTPPEAGQDPTSDVPPAPVPTGDTATPPPTVTGDAQRRGPENQPVTIRSHAPDSVVGEYRIDFDALDTDGDGYISREEARVNEVLTAEFHVLDTNGDGRLSREEAASWSR